MVVVPQISQVQVTVQDRLVFVAVALVAAALVGAALAGVELVEVGKLQSSNTCKIMLFYSRELLSVAEGFI